MGLPTKLQDIRLLLYQRSKVEFEWTLYKDSTIREVILEEFFVNPNAWHMNVSLVVHMNVSLVVYITIEMHETDRVLRPMSGWTLGHPSSMYYMPTPSIFLMMMYRPSMF
ncbi:hypothetical protein J1N35_015356 [Gossypium stocksii]|uniref:Uncharacterized protein n=1 Tax=Gossypium stocksii TaxID=47602 RepID=A0A9D4A9T2_9ROSI|nr:hypothetical protein J1N35_015356 [Gossypium stocksii]